MIQLLLVRYINIYFFQFKIIQSETSTSFRKRKGSFSSTDLERKVSLTKHWSQNIPKQIFSLYKPPGNFIISELTQWRIARLLEILFWDMNCRVMTYLEPRLLTIKDVAVKDTRSGRSDRTTNIRCSSLHAFSHSPAEEIDKQRTWKGNDFNSTANSRRLSHFHNWKIYDNKSLKSTDRHSAQKLVLANLIRCILKGSVSVLKRGLPNKALDCTAFQPNFGI